MTTQATATTVPAAGADTLGRRFRTVRDFSLRLAEPLAVEDQVIQTMPDVSPTKWHLAHTTWFFEEFVLSQADAGYRRLHPQFARLFNSYYLSVGQPWHRPHRGNLSRPTVGQVRAYREHVDARMAEILASADEPMRRRLDPVIELGLNHEQQHQELILTDVKHVLSQNVLTPTYRERAGDAPAEPVGLIWIERPGGLVEIGHAGGGFCYDNERPRHKVHLEPHRLANRLVTCGEFLAFIEDGGYETSTLWLSMGWDWVNETGAAAPLYWYRRDGQWRHFTLAGERAIDPAEPVTHVSYFEADAFARWSGARLPTEAEWESAAEGIEPDGNSNFVEDERYHPAAPQSGDGLLQMFGDAWEWTRSQYYAYPGYRPPPGAIGEYNGKFMCNQFVLRGGSCATSRTHIRPSYRNFFPPDARWQFTGIRLAKDTTWPRPTPRRWN